MTDQHAPDPCPCPDPGPDRPRLLVRAARLGLEDYARERDLPRVLRRLDPDGAGATLARLRAGEERLEALRRAGGATYSAALHVEAMIALMAEMRLFDASRPANDQAKASGSDSLRRRMNACNASSVPGSSIGCA